MALTKSVRAKSFSFPKEHFIQKLGNSGERDATCLSSDGER